MRFLVLAAALFCSFQVLATTSPEALYMPKPVYPEGMSNIRGHARISLNLHNDGSVSDVKVLNATHPAFADAAINAAKLWRFKPWTPSADMPAIIDANNDMIFAPQNDITIPFQKPVTAVVSQTCNALNDEVAQWRRDQPSRPLSAMRSFALVHAYMVLPVLSGSIEYPASLSATDDFDNALPEIVRKCRSQPKGRFIDHLPETVRVRL
ncbi:TonB family protein [Pseudomonas sp. O64]|uniref:TonB family protein n=1 Tax=unclassified Pseudomonas TaxID=196821 RepID=UPI001F57F69D|nr:MULTISPECIES: TonB family protein [unclassified Pseudomonas]UNM20245.1 energy transducer TonB [Pseudomonas sp. ArH3a]UXZ23006.1 energy transducer TonB [Pseudomonas sp. YeP6b]